MQSKKPVLDTYLNFESGRPEVRLTWWTDKGQSTQTFGTTQEAVWKMKSLETEK